MSSQTVLIKLDYPYSLHQRYQNFSHLPGFVLLESADIARGRYDILSAYPYDRIQCNNDPEECLELLNQTLARNTSSIDLPFQGGAIGYISYDLGANLLGLECNPLVSNMPLVDLGLYDWAIIVDHYARTTTLVLANTQKDTEDLVSEIINLWRGSGANPSAFHVKTNFSPYISKDQYDSAFYAIQQALQEGRTYQVNYTQPFHAEYTGNTWSMYQQVIRNNPVPFAAYLRGLDGDILSFSPERFLLYDNQSMLTSPIKGTIRRSLSADEDELLKQQLQSCAKNLAENVMIVDLMRNDLGKISKPGSVKVSKLCEVQSFKAVHHLVSDIVAECLPTISPWTAMLSCFPGGSITGAPKLESMKIINELEPFARGVYCGSIGYFSNHGRFDTNIAIRTLTARENVLHLAAGGGIVINSKLDDEYRECFTKIEAIIYGLK